MTRSGAGASRSIAQRAEALLRSLVGISKAEVHIRPTGGVERVRVVADGGLSNGQIVQNVRSALLATFGVVLQPAQIEFVATEAWAADPALVPAAQPPAAVAPPQAAAEPAVRPDDSIPERQPAAAAAGPANGRATNGQDSRNGSATRPGNGVRPDAGNGVNGTTQRPRQVRELSEARRTLPRRHAPLEAVRTVAPPRAPETHPPVAPAVAGAAAEVAIGSRLVRLDKAETIRLAGRVRCRIVLAAGTDRYSAVADCRDEPLAEVQLAARVTCDALRAGDLTSTHFEGATIANLAGVAHVVVALNGWKAGAPVRRSGSAVIKESIEQAAALAVLHALANT